MAKLSSMPSGLKSGGTSSDWLCRVKQYYAVGKNIFTFSCISCYTWKVYVKKTGMKIYVWLPLRGALLCEERSPIWILCSVLWSQRWNQSWESPSTNFIQWPKKREAGTSLGNPFINLLGMGARGRQYNTNQKTHAWIFFSERNCIILRIRESYSPFTVCGNNF